MKIKWQFTNDKPIYAQIVTEIQRLIVSGELKMGDKLDSVRDIAFDAKVNPNTVQRALSELERTGLVYSQRTNGRFITDDAELVTKMRNELARKDIGEFLNAMGLLGFDKDEITELIKNYQEEQK